MALISDSEVQNYRHHNNTIKRKFGGQLSICHHAESGERLVSWTPGKHSRSYWISRTTGKPGRVLCCCDTDKGDLSRAAVKCMRKHVRGFRHKARHARINRRGWA